MKTLKKLIILWFPVVIWAGVVYAFSARPSIETTEIMWQDFIIKKLAHVIEYFVLFLLLYRAFKNSGVKPIKSIVVSIIICFLYGASDEFHQSFTPGREPRARDVVFDTIGALLGAYLIWTLLPKMPKRLKILATKLGLA